MPTSSSQSSSSNNNKPTPIPQYAQNAARKASSALTIRPIPETRVAIRDSVFKRKRKLSPDKVLGGVVVLNKYGRPIESNSNESSNNDNARPRSKFIKDNNIDEGRAIRKAMKKHQKKPNPCGFTLNESKLDSIIKNLENGKIPNSSDRACFRYLKEKQGLLKRQAKYNANLVKNAKENEENAQRYAMVLRRRDWLHNRHSQFVNKAYTLKNAEQLEMFLKREKRGFNPKRLRKNYKERDRYAAVLKRLKAVKRKKAKLQGEFEQVYGGNEDGIRQRVIEEQRRIAQIKFDDLRNEYNKLQDQLNILDTTEVKLRAALDNICQELQKRAIQVEEKHSNVQYSTLVQQFVRKNKNANGPPNPFDDLYDNYHALVEENSQIAPLVQTRAKAVARGKISIPQIRLILIALHKLKKNNPNNNSVNFESWAQKLRIARKEFIEKIKFSVISLLDDCIFKAMETMLQARTARLKTAAKIFKNAADRRKQEEKIAKIQAKKNAIEKRRAARKAAGEDKKRQQELKKQERNLAKQQKQAEKELKDAQMLARRAETHGEEKLVSLHYVKTVKRAEIETEYAINLLGILQMRLQKDPKTKGLKARIRQVEAYINRITALKQKLQEKQQETTPAPKYHIPKKRRAIAAPAEANGTHRTTARSSNNKNSNKQNNKNSNNARASSNNRNSNNARASSNNRNASISNASNLINTPTQHRTTKLAKRNPNVYLQPHFREVAARQARKNAIARAFPNGVRQDTDLSDIADHIQIAQNLRRLNKRELRRTQKYIKERKKMGKNYANLQNTHFKRRKRLFKKPTTANKANVQRRVENARERVASKRALRRLQMNANNNLNFEENFINNNNHNSNAPNNNNNSPNRQQSPSPPKRRRLVRLRNMPAEN